MDVFSQIADVYQTQIIDAGKQPEFLLLLSFLLTFGFIRTSTRLMRSPNVTWWPGSVKTEGGLHIHHMVFGIILLLITGFLGFSLRPDSPAWEILAIFFGIGAGLTLDEYALWLHLKDVYWAEEGRSSIDAVILATVFASLVFLGVSPFDLDKTQPLFVSAISVTIVLFLCIITFLKGKTTYGVLGLFIPIFSTVGAIRLAKPNSPWAHWRYEKNEGKMAKSHTRFIEDRRKRNAIKKWFKDKIGGVPGIRS